MRKLNLFFIMSACVIFMSCHKEVKTFNNVNFSFNFDENQVRLNDLGDTAVMPAGHAAQIPDMHSMSVHYIELTPDEFTAFGDGAVLYKAPETNAGGANAIDFDSSLVTSEGNVFLKVNLNRLPPGTYKYIRASVAYQNYDIKYNILNIPSIGDLTDQSGTVASFLGFNTYIRTLTVNHLSIPINANKLQGFWAFETELSSPYDIYNAIYSGQAPAGATTVVNPLFATSPIPAGSCVITGEFNPPLEVTGSETDDLNITMSFSINNSFEWVDTNGNGQWDIDASDSSQTEQIVDMGLRGMIPSWHFGN